jgi:S-adenosylmethionine-dependent methyltransferase
MDILENSLKVAKIRCHVYGYSPQFIVGNAVDIDKHLPERQFDIAVFHASLEHMTLQERIVSLRAVWGKIIKGGILVIAETPNRLWHIDSHTSLLPFFHWLPDDLAFEYAKFSPRKGFGDVYFNREEQMDHFLRRGRGVSFHEFEIAFGDMQQIRSGKSLHEFWRTEKQTRTLPEAYADLLKKIQPGLADGFLREYLYLILYKD